MDTVTLLQTEHQLNWCYDVVFMGHVVPSEWKSLCRPYPSYTYTPRCCQSICTCSAWYWSCILYIDHLWHAPRRVFMLYLSSIDHACYSSRLMMYAPNVIEHIITWYCCMIELFSIDDVYSTYVLLMYDASDSCMTYTTCMSSINDAYCKLHISYIFIEL